MILVLTLQYLNIVLELDPISGRLNSDLRQQILKGPNLPSLTSEEKNSMQHSVQEFGTHLQNHSPELSAPTRTYLALLDCLCLSS